MAVDGPSTAIRARWLATGVVSAGVWGAKVTAAP